jgi:hypothetical protein
LIPTTIVCLSEEQYIKDFDSHIYPIYNYNWRNVSIIYIHNKIRIQRYILTSPQNNTNHINPTTCAIML